MDWIKAKICKVTKWKLGIRDNSDQVQQYVPGRDSIAQVYPLVETGDLVACNTKELKVTPDPTYKDVVVDPENILPEEVRNQF